MEPELQNKLVKVRGLKFHDMEDLAREIEREGIHFSPTELPALGNMLANSPKYKGIGSFLILPEWLLGVISELTKDKIVNSICDPYAGIGLLIGNLLKTTRASRALAFTNVASDATLGRALVKKVEWRVGNPFDLLASLNEEIDLAASILPWGLKKQVRRIESHSGQNIELKDKLENQVLAMASMRLSEKGMGLFVVTPYFFTSQNSIFRQFHALGLGLEAAMALPPGTFAPFSNMPGYLVIVRRKKLSNMFVAQLSKNSKTNQIILSNLKHKQSGQSLELGCLVSAESFEGIDAIRNRELLDQAQQKYKSPAVPLEELATIINLGRYGEKFQFQKAENSIFVPLIGSSDVVDSPEDMTLKSQNYAQVVIDPSRSYARFVAQFLNSDYGKEMRELHKTGAVIPKINKKTLKELTIFVPDLETQQVILDIEARITDEENILLGLQNEIREIRRELWRDPNGLNMVNEHLTTFSSKISGSLKKHVTDSLDQWFEMLPFPLASILRAWQATQSNDFKTKYEHLLHFFEATSEFIGLIHLSAFHSDQQLFEQYRSKIMESMEKYSLSFKQATFGTWKLVVEFLGRQTRALLADKDHGRARCVEIFSDPSAALPEALSSKELMDILSKTNKMRNNWSGHGGVVGHNEARLRNEELLGQVQKLRDVMSDVWGRVQLIQAIHCVPRNGRFENEVAVLMGSNSEFLKETKSMNTWLDVEHLYLSPKEETRPLKLLPLIRIDSSPESAKKACYFYNRTEKDGLRFVSYHFIDQPENKEPLDEPTSKAIIELWGDEIS